MHKSNKIVDKGTPRPAVMIIREFIWVVSSPRKVCSVSGVRQFLRTLSEKFRQLSTSFVITSWLKTRLTQLKVN